MVIQLVSRDLRNQTDATESPKFVFPPQQTNPATFRICVSDVNFLKGHKDT